MKKQGSDFIRWFSPLLLALRSFGGSAKPREVSEYIAKDLNLAATVLDETLTSGANRFHNQVQWARQYLVWEGLLDSNSRGIWKLTQRGWDANIDDESARQIVGKWVKINQKKSSGGEKKSIEETVVELAPSESEECGILKMVYSLSPDSFEFFCQSLLRELGMEDVEVVGGSHDGGLDGIGFLRLNPLLRIKVAFQCKRTNSVLGRSVVGDFRNAVLGRAEKGIIFTTAWFSSDAKKEASREGVLPIELVDGERIVELMQDHKFGVIERVAFDVDHSFFERFNKTTAAN
jgi:restriction system protein